MAPSPQPTAPTPAAGVSHYQLLELPVSASDRELRRAFRLLSKRYHPDTTSLPPDQAAEAFRRLQQAYAVLSDPPRRREYDLRLSATATATSTATAATAFAAEAPAAPRRLDRDRRALSGGEWFALLLLALALVFSLVLGVGLAWSRGVELVRWPSWWVPPDAPAASTSTASIADVDLAA
jgi:DnaJ-domain-containing protein 1